ncbi:MAG: hypothetical protein GXX93_06280 [Anaerolineae bacterium]|nr:hypothetical protein [Anaerolineae bacterium]
MPKPSQREPTVIGRLGRTWVLLLAFLGVILAAVLVWVLVEQEPVAAEAPEADKVLAVQAEMPFQILIPSYLPKGFDRTGVEILVNQSGPGGEPMVQLTYRNRKGATIFIREWVPMDPSLETLSGSRPIQTRWGKGYMLTQSQQSLCALWVDVGPLRTSVYSHNMDQITREQIVGIGNSMGPASNRQVFTFSLEPAPIQNVAPPPPYEAPLNEEGVQELTLVSTPGGYNPLRFTVQKDVPVRLHFRMLGEVGSGNVLILPTADGEQAVLTLESQGDVETLDFTPTIAGEYEFYCAHHMYRGIMTVRE